MSHCKRVRDMKADLKRALRWARNKDRQPRVITIEMPDGTRNTAYQWAIKADPCD